jgi:hypothetical protein
VLLTTANPESAIALVDSPVLKVSRRAIALQRVRGHILEGNSCLEWGPASEDGTCFGPVGFNKVEARPVPAKSRWHSGLGGGQQ